MIDQVKESCLSVFKSGATTGITFGKANNVASYIRNGGGLQSESREWAIIPTDKRSGAFSDEGGSGASVADAYGRIAGLLTGGAGATDSCDVRYVTPISFIMEVLHNTELFPKPI